MEQFRLISVRELDDYVSRYPEVLLIDLRPRQDYQRFHIRHAINIPYEEGLRWTLPRGKELVLYCERGSSSMAAARRLVKEGYHVVSVSGGISEYRGRNLVFSDKS